MEGKLKRPGKGPIVSNIDRAGFIGERRAVEQERDQAPIVRVPPTGAERFCDGPGIEVGGEQFERKRRPSRASVRGYSFTVTFM
jgi:hypothetical protein